MNKQLIAAHMEDLHLISKSSMRLIAKSMCREVVYTEAEAEAKIEERFARIEAEELIKRVSAH